MAMMSDWYFTCCTGANPQTADAALAIFDTLNDESASPSLLAIAVRELVRAEDRIRLYGLRYVLRAINRPGGLRTVDPVVALYFDSITELVDETVRLDISEILEAIVTDGNLRDSQSIAQVADHLVSLDERKTTVVPYLDMLESCAEIVLLSTLVAFRS